MAMSCWKSRARSLGEGVALVDGGSMGIGDPVTGVLQDAEVQPDACKNSMVWMATYT